MIAKYTPASLVDWVVVLGGICAPTTVWLFQDKAQSLTATGTVRYRRVVRGWR